MKPRCPSRDFTLSLNLIRCGLLLISLSQAYKLNVATGDADTLSAATTDAQQHHQRVHPQKVGKWLLQLSSSEMEERYFDPILKLLKTGSSAGSTSSMLMLEPFYEVIMLMKKEGFTPQSVDMMNGLIQMIDGTLKPNLVASVGNLSFQLNDTYTKGYAACDTQFASASANTAAQAALQTASLANQACRNVQSQLQTNYDNCMSQLNSLTGQRTTSCNLANAANQPGAASCPRLVANESYGTYTLRFQNYYAALYANVTTALGVCQNLTSAVNNQTGVCTAANTVLVNQTSNCSSVQTAMDNAACRAYQYNLDMCSNYTNCYSQFTFNYNNYVQGITVQVQGMQAQLSALYQIKCLLNTLSSTNGASSCGNTTQTGLQATQDLQLIYPSPVPKVAQPCPVTALTPGTSGWNQTLYSILPINAPAQVCRASCCPTCSSFACPSGTARITGAWGNSSATCCSR
jgi:hypothetical protein